MGKTYIGARHRDTGEARVFIEEARLPEFAGQRPGERLSPLPHICLHSPAGIEWGYAGSGPADCALSILVDFFGEIEVLPASCFGRYSPISSPVILQTKAWQLHQEFSGWWLPVYRNGTPEAGVALRRADILYLGEIWLQAWRLDTEQVREAVVAILNKGLRCLNCMSLLSGGACQNHRCPVSSHRPLFNNWHDLSEPWHEDEV